MIVSRFHSLHSERPFLTFFLIFWKSLPTLHIISIPSPKQDHQHHWMSHQFLIYHLWVLLSLRLLLWCRWGRWWLLFNSYPFRWLPIFLFSTKTPPYDFQDIWYVDQHPGSSTCAEEGTAGVGICSRLHVSDNTEELFIMELFPEYRVVLSMYNWRREFVCRKTLFFCAFPLLRFHLFHPLLRG